MSKNLVIILGAGASLGELGHFQGKINNEQRTDKFFENYENLRCTHPHLYTLVDSINHACPTEKKRFSLTFIEIFRILIAKWYLYGI